MFIYNYAYFFISDINHTTCLDTACLKVIGAKKNLNIIIIQTFNKMKVDICELFFQQGVSNKR